MKLNQIKKLKINMITSLANRMVILISGLIIPRLILTYYGSETNGLITSLNQFLSIITFLDLGVSAVVQSALYKPLADRNYDDLNGTLNAARNYFKNLAYILLGYILLLVIFYPMVIKNNVDFYTTTFLILALSIAQFSQYYFGIVNEFLLNADQKSYIQLTSEIITVALNFIFTVVLIQNGASIQLVKFVAGLVYLIRPVYLNWYVKNNYPINHQIKPRENAIPQKWNGVAQHIAYTVQTSTDIVILTIFSTLEQISIYAIYNLVVQGIKLIITSLTNEFKAFFGNMLAKNEITKLQNYFTKMEWIVHNGVVFLYGMAILLIVPFVELYTNTVDDVSYYAPTFALLLITGQLIYSIRTPYQSMILAAGHFKETQLGSILEALINIVMSLLLINNFGLIGLALGTIFAMTFRTCELILYLSKNILFRSIRIFLKLIIVDVLNMLFIFGIGNLFLSFYSINSPLTWILAALMLSVISILIIAFTNIIFYKNLMLDLLKR